MNTIKIEVFIQKGLEGFIVGLWVSLAHSWFKEKSRSRNVESDYLMLT